MLFVLDRKTANELAGVADAASTDQQRPILGCVLLEFDTHENGAVLRAVATDSYMLAKREVFCDDDDFVADEGDAQMLDQRGKRIHMVNAKAWKKSLKDAIAASKLDMHKVYVSVEPSGVTITRAGGVSPEFRLDYQHGSFPNWEQLVKEPITRLEDATTSLPAFNPVYLARIATICSASPKDRDLPVRVAAQSTQDAELKPWYFMTKRGYRPGGKGAQSELTVLLMPVRV